MLKLATAGRSDFVVSEIELNREEISWTVDTLTLLRDERPEDELFFLIGADSLRDFSSWKEPETIAELATVVAVNRGEASLDELTASLKPELSASVRLVTMPEFQFRPPIYVAEYPLESRSAIWFRELLRSSFSLRSCTLVRIETAKSLIPAAKIVSTVRWLKIRNRIFP